MNALAYNPRTGVVDFVGGKADIAGDLVRCVEIQIGDSRKMA